MVMLNSSSRQRGRRRGLMSEINVTPFVDVMLVLLIVFMITAPLLTTGVPVNLPRTKASALPTSLDPPLVVTVAQDGKIYVGSQDNAVTTEQLGGVLSAAAGSAKDDRWVIVRGDAKTAHGDIVVALNTIKQAGFTKVGLQTDANAQVVPAQKKGN